MPCPTKILPSKPVEFPRFAPPLFEDAEITTFAVGLLVGAALVVADLGQILQASQVKPWGGFNWNRSTGIAEVVCGVFSIPLPGPLQ
jgi:uncharacterized membrane protein HdeD (DUF308 family)